MKKVLSIAVVALMVALVFTSCKKDPTMTDNLCYEKGWKLSALTCENPGYGNACRDNACVVSTTPAYSIRLPSPMPLHTIFTDDDFPFWRAVKM